MSVQGQWVAQGVAGGGRVLKRRGVYGMLEEVSAKGQRAVQGLELGLVLGSS